MWLNCLRKSNVFYLQVQVENEESDKSYESSWSYMQDVQSNALIGHERRSFHKELSDSKVIAAYM